MSRRIGTVPRQPTTIGEVVEVADGVTALKVERPTILPPKLDQLIDSLRYQRSRPVRMSATRRACVDGEHQRVPWVTGVLRDVELRLDVCTFCGGVEVRDVSLDVHPGIRPGAAGPARRSDVLGWYSGRRVAGREYI